jgi:hypothetical protein
MRPLAPPPPAVADPITCAPHIGSFLGGLPPVDFAPLAPRALDRVLRQKRWIYFAIATDEALIALAVVRLGYLANAFAFVFDRAAHRMIAHRTALAPPFAIRVGDDPAHLDASARLLGGRIRIERPRLTSAFLVQAELGEISLFARLDAASAPPAISVIAPVPGGGLAATEKRTLLAARGAALVSGRRIPLEGALAGYDYSNGLLPRRTVWRWGFALGRARSGERVALNLVEGMTGEAECALWIDGALLPLAEGRFSFDPAQPLAPWHVRTADGAVDLRFTPGGMHADHTNVGLVRARFIQPAGVYAGTVRTPDGRVLELDGILGVTEDQDVLW